MIDHCDSVSVHMPDYAIIGTLSQAKTSDNRDCDIRNFVRNRAMADQKEIKTTQPEAVEVLTLLDSLGVTQRELAARLNLSENKISKVRAGDRRMQAGEVLKARAWLSQIQQQGGYREEPDLPTIDPQNDYVPVEVLPVHAGAGGGGIDISDNREREVALVPRALIKDILRGKPQDFLLINVRGDSMEPDFHHGDQILVDCRDISPAQPGPFALWDGEWGEYVVKNVERSRSGEVRIFSSNSKYTSELEASENTRIIGRPVWFGRRL